MLPNVHFAGLSDINLRRLRVFWLPNFSFRVAVVRVKNSNHCCFPVRHAMVGHKSLQLLDNGRSTKTIWQSSKHGMTLNAAAMKME